jgi:hypothetical protein
MAMLIYCRRMAMLIYCRRMSMDLWPRGLIDCLNSWLSRALIFDISSCDASRPTTT